MDFQTNPSLSGNRGSASAAWTGGEYIGMKEMRKHIAWYTAGLPHSSSIRRECNMLETEEELVELLKQHGMLDKESAFKYNIQNV